ncbi:hypothetical protein FD14_GL000188 [Secundilactobacillus similis DSM 23365 = JCM 2765]|uniref:Uncharacterized protein n=2 Tax=Secundilactobacillus similis TaxID=414682 RepID=A0A0R2FNB4_9LACO|nr:hypothetical protein FD14_GL000188 [Secundilactobacillus similis DSM 23365 = JCM 2765]
MAEFSRLINQTPTDGTEYLKLTKAYNQFLYGALPERDFFFIARRLDYPITNEEGAELISGAYNGQDYIKVLPLDSEALTILKTRLKRQ